MTKGITKVSVRGYKSLVEECSIEIRRLTVLAGPNSSGKSSIMQPLLLMKQTLEESYDPGHLKINGPNVNFTRIEQFLPKTIRKGQPEDLMIGVEIDGEKSIYERFRVERKKEIEIIEMKYNYNGQTIILKPTMRTGEILSSNWVINENWLEFNNRLNELTSIGGDKKLRLTSELKVKRDRCFLELKHHFKFGADHEDEVPFVVNIEPFEKRVREIIHVPALRGNPRRNYEIAAKGASFPGTFENYMASVVYEWQQSRDSRISDLGNWLGILGLTWKVDSKKVDDTNVEIRVGRLEHSTRGGSKDLVSIADVGFGVSQTLPVLVALLAARPGQMVYIEQPEIHLHPRAQVALSGILAEAANRGVRVVIETHSSLLLLGIQSQIANDVINPKHVKLHWFKRRPDDGITEIISADMDRAGAFGEWPEDFADVELNARIRYMDAADEKLEII